MKYKRIHKIEVDFVKHLRKDYWYISLLPGVELGYQQSLLLSDIKILLTFNITWLFFDLEIKWQITKMPTDDYYVGSYGEWEYIENPPGEFPKEVNIYNN